MTALEGKVANLPLAPGVYLMKDAQGKVLYVGKAVSLKKRVQSYFSAAPKAVKVAALVKRIHELEVMVTASELDALILENTLIKKYRPTYNVELKDDKNYPYVRLQESQTYPRLEIVRHRRRDGALYFGPYPSVGALRETLALLQKHFLLRRCSNRQFVNRLRPCLNYQMKLCQGPCCQEVDPDTYRHHIDQVIMFLRGKGQQVVDGLAAEMSALAAEQHFEAAASLRDTIFALQKIMANQEVDSAAGDDLDVIGLAGDENQGFALYLLTIRRGKVVGGRPFAFYRFAGYAGELIAAFMQRYYSEEVIPPPVILVSQAVGNHELLECWLGALRKRKVELTTPIRGRKAALLSMATDNARAFFRQQQQDSTDLQQVLAALGRKTGMKMVPAVIECVDISNFQGDFPVASLVCFVNGRPQKDSYRRYRLDEIAGPDDFAMMAAVMERRFGSGADAREKPDMLLVDGGKGQLSAVARVLDRLQVDVSIVAIAKGRDKRGKKSRAAVDSFYIRDRKNPLSIHLHSGAYLLLQQIRDEAHRFAISYHRQRSRKNLTETSLLGIPGIGPVRARGLLEHYGSLQGVQKAGLESLERCSFLDWGTASRVFQYFKS
ncbi:MAG: excinuclease ABC subunit UvrC [Pseudomonadota bacterium]|nr:excinuclease ABC subunit UvrC [Pseudomonadota bacterium]